MAKQAQKVTFSFIDPNKAGAVERVLRRILIEKLTALHNSQTTGSHQ